MQVGLDKPYNEIDEFKTFIENVEIRLYNTKHRKIDSSNEYQLVLFSWDNFMTNL